MKDKVASWSSPAGIPEQEIEDIILTREENGDPISHDELIDILEKVMPEKLITGVVGDDAFVKAYDEYWDIHKDALVLEFTPIYAVYESVDDDDFNNLEMSIAEQAVENLEWVRTYDEERSNDKPVVVEYSFDDPENRKVLKRHISPKYLTEDDLPVGHDATWCHGWSDFQKHYPSDAEELKDNKWYPKSESLYYGVYPSVLDFALNEAINKEFAPALYGYDNLEEYAYKVLAEAERKSSHPIAEIGDQILYIDSED